MSDFEDNDKEAKKHLVKAIETKVEVHTFQFPDFTEESLQDIDRSLEEELRSLEKELRVLKMGQYSFVKKRVGNVLYVKFREEDWR